MLNPWIILALVGVLAGSNLYTGLTVRSYMADKCNAAALASQIAQLNTQLAAARAAAEADRKALDDARAETERLEEAARELEGSIGDRVCFTVEEFDSIRNLWGGVTIRPLR